MTDTNPPADRTGEIKARLARISNSPVPWSSHFEIAGMEIVEPVHEIIDANGGRVCVTDTGSWVAELLEHAPADLAHLLARVEDLEGQLAKARSTAAIDALTTGRRFISDHREQLRKDRSRFDQRFQGRLQGLEEAAGNLTTLIKSLRANEPGIEASDEH
jgi:hypothetical protein